MEKSTNALKTAVLASLATVGAALAALFTLHVNDCLGTLPDQNDGGVAVVLDGSIDAGTEIEDAGLDLVDSGVATDEIEVR